MHIPYFKLSEHQLYISDIKITLLQCTDLFIVKVPVDGYCTKNEHCQGNEHSGVCEQGRCVCKAGYIQFNLKCYERKLDYIP